MQPSVTIYMKPYLVEYAKCKMGNGIFANKELITKVVKLFIRRGVYSGKPYTPKNHLAKFEITLPFISDIHQNDNKIYIHPKDYISISNFYQAHFDDSLFMYVQDKVRYYGEIKKCIIQFCDDYNIPWEYVNEAMMRKKYNRWKNKQHKKQTFISSLSVPNLSHEIPFLL